MTRERRSFTPEFKLEAASLVVDQNYSVPEACQALGFGESFGLRVDMSSVSTHKKLMSK